LVMFCFCCTGQQGSRSARRAMVFNNI
jgi:hypothetical protein